MDDFKQEYINLEERVLSELRNKVMCSKENSKHVQEKCIKVNIFGYTELTIINDKLVFLDNNGLEYSLWNGDCDLDDFIDILNDNI